jgi:predicted nicotinamide N-methyase
MPAVYPAIRAIEEDLLDRYPLQDQRVELPDRILTLLAAEKADDLITGATDPDDLPFWAEIWPAGKALARYLYAGPLPRGPVLEMGAGVGVVGLALALRGATVVQTDRMVDALRAARVNAERCNVLDRIFPVAADWRRWSLAQRFTLAVGGDITYDRSFHDALLNALRRSLLPGGTVLLADPGRPSGEQFAQRLRAARWRVTEYPLPLPERASGPGRLLRALAP